MMDAPGTAARLADRYGPDVLRVMQSCGDTVVSVRAARAH